MEKYKNKYRTESTRLKNWDYGWPGLYFITICTKDRIEYFGEITNGKMELNQTGKIAEKNWSDLPNHFANVTLDEFIIMPNHVHGVLAIVDDRGCNDIYTPNNVNPNVVGSRRNAINRVSTGDVTTTNEIYGGITKTKNPMLYKNVSTMIRWFKGRTTFEINKSNPDLNFAWQPRFYDHIIRNVYSLDNIRNYIMSNPENYDADEYQEKS